MSTVQPINFQGKTRYLSDNAYNNMKSVLTKMNHSTGYINGDNVFSTSHLTRLRLYDDSATFCDSRFLLKKVEDNEQMQGKTLISTRNAQVEIDNRSGEVKGLDKPLFSTWTKVIKKVEQSIQRFAENFENSKYVKRGYISLIGWTKDGETKINKVIEHMEK